MEPPSTAATPNNAGKPEGSGNGGASVALMCAITALIFLGVAVVFGVAAGSADLGDAGNTGPFSLVCALFAAAAGASAVAANVESFSARFPVWILAFLIFGAIASGLVFLAFMAAFDAS
jgi:uncharacterized RDD family membrane protein YckC